MARDLGDFQTPPALVALILACLQRMGGAWSRVLEPTCGRGNFIEGLLTLDTPIAEIQGIEVQEPYVTCIRNKTTNITSKHIVIQQDNIFKLNLGYDIHWQNKGPLLIIGNPPWVTNSELSTLGSANIPVKTNLKNLVGLEALTGSSNFDIAEYIWLKLIRELGAEEPTIALLCKTAVARNVLQFVAKAGLPISNAVIRKIDAKKWFGAAVDACLFCVDVRPGKHDYEARIYPDLESDVPTSIIQVVNGKLIINSKVNAKLRSLDGISPLTWRQGLKHDAATVVELKVDTMGNLYNKQGESVLVESEYIYPLLKSSDLAGKGKAKTLRAIIVPQKRIGDDTHQLMHVAPELWRYLTMYSSKFQQRKSVIYQNQPPFAYFGLGDYSFSPYKVAISGMYKSPIFRAIGPTHNRPVMLDDTCYFLPCVSGQQAAFIASLLNHPLCIDFLHSITFWDAKRPITKKLLQRINLIALLQLVERETLLKSAQQEYRRLQSDQGIQKEPMPTWPDSLVGLLTKSPHRSQTVQMTLLEGA